MARNARLHKCPRCGQFECEHSERLLANALATVYSGTMNIDLSASRRWLISSRDHRRTVFVELKDWHELPPGEESGQTKALADITGTLTTPLGRTFEQRSFFVIQTLGGWGVTTFWETGHWLEMIHDASLEDVAYVIGEWIRDGVICLDRPK